MEKSKALETSKNEENLASPSQLYNKYNVICSGHRGSDKDITDLKNPLSNAEKPSQHRQEKLEAVRRSEGRLLRDQAGAELVVWFSHLLVFAPSTK